MLCSAFVDCLLAILELYKTKNDEKEALRASAIDKAVKRYQYESV